MSTDSTRPALINAAALSALTSINVHTLRADRLGAKRIPFVRIGKLVRYDPSRVLAVLATLEVGGPVVSTKGAK